MKKLLKRKIDSFLVQWKNNPDKKPLIVKGARQIGKTRSIERFAVMNYKRVVQINFVEQPKYRSIFDDGFDVDGILKNISKGFFWEKEIRRREAGLCIMEKTPHDMVVRFWNNPMTVDEVKPPQGKPFRLVNLPYYYAGQLNGVLDRLA